LLGKKELRGDDMNGEPIRPDPKPAPRERKPRRWMRKRSPRRLRRQSREEKQYLAWLHAQWCVGVEAIPGHQCTGPIQASHFRDVTGLGRKEPDTTCIPLCRALHESYDQALGFFAGIPKDERKLWHQTQQIKIKVRYECERLQRKDWT
jgi:hypothetical protein